MSKKKAKTTAAKKPVKAEVENLVVGAVPEKVREDLPTDVLEFLRTTTGVSRENPVDGKVIDQIFKGNPHIATSLRERGIAEIPNHFGRNVVLGAGFNTDGNLVSTAAAVPRSPGKSEDFLAEVADFSDDNSDRTTLLDLYDRVYRREGLVNNAINKSAALVATEGEFKVRYVKGKRGVSGDARAEELRLLLKFWQENLNMRAEDASITGDRGLPAFIAQGTRQTLKQGDHFGRENWVNVKVPTLQGKAFSLPMNIQSYDARNIEIPEGIEGTPVELYYWVPPSDFIETLRNPADENVKEYLDKLIPSEVQSELINEGKYLLDPALMIHIKYRGTSTSNYGESMIEPAMNEIAYKRALQALDMVTIENLINRLVIILIGSDQADSVYHKQEVTSARMTMMSNMLRRVGPAATIIWPGPDVDIKEVGAHDAILDMDERYKQAEFRIRNALGVPAALLTGEGADGKAAGWAAIIGVAAELQEVQRQYAQVLRTIGERIALENGYEDVDLVWEFHQELLTNKQEHVEMITKAYQAGLLSIPTALEELGFDFDAEWVRMLQDVDNDRRDTAFGAPRGYADLQMGPDQMDGGDGRPSNTNETDPRNNTEQNSPEERN